MDNMWPWNELLWYGWIWPWPESVVGWTWPWPELLWCGWVWPWPESLWCGWTWPELTSDGVDGDNPDLSSYRVGGCDLDLNRTLWCGWAWPWPELLSCCGWAWPWPELNSNDVVDVNDLDLNWTLVTVTFYNTLSGIQVTWMFFCKTVMSGVYKKKKLMWLQSVWGAEVRACAEESQSSGYPRFRLCRFLNKAGCKGLSLNNIVWKSD